MNGAFALLCCGTRAAGFALAAWLGLGGAWAQAPNQALREQVTMIPKGSGLLSVALEATTYRPPGEGPFPVVVINHGKASGDPRFQARARYAVPAREFVQRGYLVVIPMRQGFSKSGGYYVGGGCNVEDNGRRQAEDVVATLAHMKTWPDADLSRILVIGQSHGGLTTLAFGALNHPGVLGLINFAGGLRPDRCAGWESTLVDAFGAYARETRAPSLWFYGDNDSYWPPRLYRAMHESYRAAGGKARLVAFGDFAADAHGLFGPRSGLSLWVPEVDRFLAEVGLPFVKVHRISGVADEAAAPVLDVWDRRCHRAQGPSCGPAGAGSDVA
jgi:dienelactone hydrolase